MFKEIHYPSITEISLKIIYLKFHSNLSSTYRTYVPARPDEASQSIVMIQGETNDFPQVLITNMSPCINTEMLKSHPQLMSWLSPDISRDFVTILNYIMEPAKAYSKPLMTKDTIKETYLTYISLRIFQQRKTDNDETLQNVV